MSFLLSYKLKNNATERDLGSVLLTNLNENKK